MANPPTQSGTLKTVLGAIVIALIAGGSSPWWFDRVFPKSPPVSSSFTGPTQTPQGSEPAAPPVSQFVMSALQYDKNIVGGDLDSKGKPAASAADCSDLCMSDDRCHAMTYIKSQQICWLKHSNDGGTSETTDMISAVKQIAK